MSWNADEPEWLTPDESVSWYAFSSLLLRLGPALDGQLQRDAGINTFEYGILAALSETDERSARLSDLAVLAEGTLPRLSQAVGRLERRGWVRRTPDPDDGRSTLAVLTDAGLDKVVATAPGRVREVRRLVFDSLTKAQVGQLAAISTRIVRAIDPDDRCLVERP